MGNSPGQRRLRRLAATTVVEQVIEMTESRLVCEPLVRTPDYIKGVITMGVDHTPAEVWEMLTQPENLTNWLAPGMIELRVGGAVRLAFEQSGVAIDSQVTALRPLEAISFSWSGPGEPERPIEWAIAPRETGSEVRLTVQVPHDEDAARACAGWAAHLEMLAAALEGAAAKFSFETFKTCRAAYAVEGASSA